MGNGDVVEITEDEFFDLLDEEIGRAVRYRQNPRTRQPTQEPERPTNIVVEHEQVDDFVRINNLMKELLDAAYGEYEPEGRMGKLATLRIVSQGVIDDVTEYVLDHRKPPSPTGQRHAPIIVEKGMTDRYYPIVVLIEHSYGRVYPKWLKSKPSNDMMKARRQFYNDVWHIGHLYRHGTPAISTSPWILGERRAIQGDPMGDRPI